MVNKARIINKRTSGNPLVPPLVFKNQFCNWIIFTTDCQTSFFNLFLNLAPKDHPLLLEIVTLKDWLGSMIPLARNDSLVISR